MLLRSVDQKKCGSEVLTRCRSKVSLRSVNQKCCSEKSIKQVSLRRVAQKCRSEKVWFRSVDQVSLRSVNEMCGSEGFLFGSRELRRSNSLRRLLNDEGNTYCKFHADHEKFLDLHNGSPSEVVAKRPLHFIQELGLGCAVWLSLYWTTTMCETHERYTDHGRLEREHDEEGLEDVEGADGQRHSVKRSFRANLLSPLLGYGADFALLQFVYDLQIWSELGAKRNLAKRQGNKLRLMMAQHPMSPLYWRAVVRQIGSIGPLPLGSLASLTASSCWTSSANNCALATAPLRTKRSASHTGPRLWQAGPACPATRPSGLAFCSKAKTKKASPLEACSGVSGFQAQGSGACEAEF